MPKNTFLCRNLRANPNFGSLLPRDLAICDYLKNLALILIDDFLKTDPNF